MCATCRLSTAAFWNGHEYRQSLICSSPEGTLVNGNPHPSQSSIDGLSAICRIRQFIRDVCGAEAHTRADAVFHAKNGAKDQQSHQYDTQWVGFFFLLCYCSDWRGKAYWICSSHSHLGDVVCYNGGRCCHDLFLYSTYFVFQNVHELANRGS